MVVSWDCRTPDRMTDTTADIPADTTADIGAALGVGGSVDSARRNKCIAAAFVLLAAPSPAAYVECTRGHHQHRAGQDPESTVALLATPFFSAVSHAASRVASIP